MDSQKVQLEQVDLDAETEQIRNQQEDIIRKKSTQQQLVYHSNALEKLKSLDIKQRFNKVLELIDLQNLNSNLLPILRCYHCNRLMSNSIESFIDGEEDFQKKFESLGLDRYCCRLVYLQDYLKWKDYLTNLEKPHIERIKILSNEGNLRKIRNDKELTEQTELTQQTQSLEEKKSEAEQSVKVELETIKE
jgi:DNA-directed RNA polymerase subunit N (RpoN/RPB10)